jgi:hypothetical protein
MAVEREIHQGPISETSRPPIPLFSQTEIKPKLTISQNEIKDLAEKNGLTPTEYIEKLVRTRGGWRVNDRVKLGDPYVVISKNEDGLLFVSSTHQNPTEALRRAAEGTFTLHQLWKDGKYIPGSPQDMAEEKPPRYYALDLEGNMLEKKEKQLFDARLRSESILKQVKDIAQNRAPGDKFTLGGIKFELIFLEDDEGKAFKASQTIELSEANYEQEILVMDDAISSRIRITREGKILSEQYVRNNDASVVQAREFLHLLDIRLPK